MADKYLKFYHISRDASPEKADSFLSEGIVPGRGCGYGGQSKGLYCWTSENRADKYYCSLLVAADAEWAMKNFGIDIRLKNGEALKIEVDIPEDTVKYPVWQLDNKQHPNVKRGRERSVFLDFWEAQKYEFNTETNFELQNHSGKRCIIRRLGWDNESRCPLLEYTLLSGKSVIEKANDTNANNSGRTQAINDYLCQNSSRYKDNYNRLISAVATNQKLAVINGFPLHTDDIAIKYCSTEPIKDFRIFRLNGEITYNPETKIETRPQSDDDINWGDYRIAITQKELPKPDDRISQLLKEVRAKIDALPHKIQPKAPQIISKPETKRLREATKLPASTSISSPVADTSSSEKLSSVPKYLRPKPKTR